MKRYSILHFAEDVPDDLNTFFGEKHMKDLKMLKSKYKKILMIITVITGITMLLIIYLNKMLKEGRHKAYLIGMKDKSIHMDPFEYYHQIENGKLVIYVNHKYYDYGKVVEYYTLSDMSTKPPKPVWEVHLFGMQNISKIIYGEINEKETHKYKEVIPPKTLIPGHKYSLLVIDWDRLKAAPEHYDFIYEP